MITTAQIERWLREDLGHHDVTNDVPGETTGRLFTKERGVVAGIDAAGAVFDYLDCSVDIRTANGDRVETGTELLRVDGNARNVLRGERVAVNLAGHASGIATKTRRAVERVDAAVDHTPGDADSSSVRVAATRKTTPGLRGLEKRAVVAGGGDTHRLDLSHMVIVKDNHVAELGLEAAIAHVRERVSFATKIEVEVESPTDAPLAAAGGADVVMLDNMSPTDCRRATDLLTDAGHDDVIVETSGGITLETIADYAQTGVDVISMGELTHSAPALDLTFKTGSETSESVD